MDESIVSSIYWKKYVEACNQSKRYLAANLFPPVLLCQEYDIALEDYRAFLDMKRMKMPFPLFPYNKKNFTTWKYLDFNFEDGKKVSCRPRLNPGWIYKSKRVHQDVN